MTIPPRPPLADTEDQARIEHTAQRERMLVGDWYADLTAELSQYLAPEMLARITHPDTTRNPLKSYNTQKNVLYDEPPAVTVKGAEAQPDLTPILRPELWPLRQRGNLLTLGLRESWMRLDWYEGIGVSYRTVTPSWTRAWAKPERPDVPVVVHEMRLRQASNQTAPWWVWERWDCTDPAAPTFQITRPGTNGEDADVTALFQATPAYPYLRKDGTGILPWVMYHAAITDTLWSWQEQRELVDGTLKIGALWTLWFHGVRDCAHPQRTALDVEAPQATSTTGLSPVDKIALDQSAILLLHSRQGRNGSTNTFPPGMDPKAMAEAIMAYDAGLAQEAGISQADLTGQGSAMSGYAIVVSRDGLRRAQRAQVAPAAMGDARLLATAAELHNAYGDGSLPTDPDAYGIVYAEVGKSAEEVKADLAEVETLTDAGLLGPIDAVRRIYPYLTRQGAIDKLVDIKRQQAEIDAALAAAGFAEVAAPAALEVTPTDLAAVVTVDEARASVDLPPATGGGA